MTVSPPRPKTLPLNALRAFKSAARLGGFVAAGQELGVSAGAISAHIKTLEDSLQAPLFSRGAQGVKLTDLGQRVLPDFTRAFDHLAAATQTLRAAAAPQVVHVAALPAVAQLWLSPRLPALRAAAPEIEISITALEQPPDLKRAPFDLCLFYDTELGEVLADDVILPVCAPALATRLQHPNDLRQLPCLSNSAWKNDWDIWLQAAVPHSDIRPRGPVYSLYALAVEETINGAGVLMGQQSLVQRHLDSGQLVAPFDLPVAAPRHLRLWRSRRLPPGSAAEKVARWLTADTAISNRPDRV